MRNLLIGITLASSLAHAEQVSTAAEQKQLSLTVYDDFALVRDQRQVPLNAGANRIAWKDVSAAIQAESALLHSTTAPVTLIEQNFDYDLLTGRALLNKYVGQEIIVITTNPQTGEEKRENATVLANNEEVMLRYADRIESALPAHARLAFPTVPENLRDRPTLTIDLHNEQAGTHDLNLNYLSNGFSWRADYVATLSPDEKQLNLAGWVTVNNNSGIDYQNAELQLVAGEVNRAPVPSMPTPMAYAAKAAVAEMAAEEALLDYHLYTLPRPTTLKNNQQKQLALLSADHIPSEKIYRLQGTSSAFYRNDLSLDEEKIPVHVLLRFDNKEPLGQALPAGIVRVYKQDSAQRLQLVGEDRLPHTAKNETVSLTLGEAFDVKATWKLLEQKRLNSNILNHDQRMFKVQVTLQNEKDEAVVVQVREPFGYEWSIEEESHPHQKTSAHQAQWDINVPAGQKVTLEYRVKIKA